MEGLFASEFKNLCAITPPYIEFRYSERKDDWMQINADGFSYTSTSASH